MLIIMTYIFKVFNDTMKLQLSMLTNAQSITGHTGQNHSVSHNNCLESDLFFPLLLTHWGPLLMRLFEVGLSLKLQWEAQRKKIAI